MEIYDDIFNKIEKYNEAIDFSISYDYGAELNSMASYGLFLGTESYDIDDKENMLKKSKEINNWCLKYLEIYMNNFIYTGSDHHI